MRSLLTRLKRREETRAGEQRYRPLRLEFGYLKELPAEYAGPRHTITIGQLPDGHFRWEERPGPPRSGKDDATDRNATDRNVMRIVLVRAKDGRLVPIEKFDEFELQT